MDPNLLDILGQSYGLIEDNPDEIAQLIENIEIDGLNFKIHSKTTNFIEFLSFLKDDATQRHVLLRHSSHWSILFSNKNDNDIFYHNQKEITQHLKRRTISVIDKQEEKNDSEIKQYERRLFIMLDENAEILRNVSLLADQNGYKFEDMGNEFHDIFKQVNEVDTSQNLFTTTDLSNLIDGATRYYSQADEIVRPEFVLLTSSLAKSH